MRQCFCQSKPIGPDKLITYAWSKHQQSTYTTNSTYVYHIDATFTNILPGQRSMQLHVGLLNGVIISWSCNIQSSITADSNYTEMKAIFHLSKRACLLWNFNTSANFDLIINAPPHIYADNQATIGLIEINKLT